MSRFVVPLLCVVLLALCVPVRAQNNQQSRASGQEKAIDRVDAINPLSGTNGDASFSRGNTVAAIVAPFGMTTWAPQTDGNDSPFYQMKHAQIEGIRATHQPSIWVREYGNFLIMPVVGDGQGSAKDRASAFTHERETAKAYHYAVDLLRYDTRLEVTPTERCAMFQVTFPATDEARIVIEAEGNIDVAFDPSKRQIRGKATHVTFGAPVGFAKYFVIEFERPFASAEVVRKDKTDTASVLLQPLTGAQANRPVRFRVGTSFIGHEQAALNLSRELPNWRFKQAVAKAKAVWDKELSIIDIEGASPEQVSTFYTAMYRVLQFPRMFHEFDADGKQVHYSPFDNGTVHEGPLYTDNGLWDTYRTAFPFFVLFTPKHSESILEGWLNAYREGGRLPNWPSPGNRPCMIGSHSDSIFADAYAKGVRSFDLQDAYLATKKNAMENDAWGWAGRDHLDEYKSLGFVPADARKEAATSCSLEYAYGDYCVAILAKAAGDQDLYKHLMARAKNYENVWDAETGFMRGKNADGSWLGGFDPLAWGGAYVEGNAWQWLWSVQHDPYGLMALMGGKEAMAEKLNTFLDMPSTTVVGGYGHVIHEMREVEHAQMGQYAHINEPNHHVLYMFNHVGQPWQAQKHVRRVLNELYDENGMLGDEDTGQMSAWYVFSAAGFYPFCPGSPNYLIGSPLFDAMAIHFPDGKAFTVEAENQAPANCYIQSATLNGKPFTRTYLHHDTITAGGTLKLVMGPEPNPNWGTGEGDLPPNDFAEHEVAN